MPFVYQGLRRYVEQAADDMGLAHPASVLPLSLAKLSHPLRMIENQVGAAQHKVDPGDRSAILSPIEGYLDAIEVMFRAGVVMARDGHTSAGLEIPDWLERFEAKVFGIGADMEEYVEPDPDDDIFSPLGPDECVLCADEESSSKSKGGKSKK